MSILQRAAGAFYVLCHKLPTKVQLVHDYDKYASDCWHEIGNGCGNKPGFPGKWTRPHVKFFQLFKIKIPFPTFQIPGASIALKRFPVCQCFFRRQKLKFWESPCRYVLAERKQFFCFFCSTQRI
jgi:hypothetical protein